MAKKTKPSVDNIVKKVNKEFEKTASQIENLIHDALKQLDSLQNQIQDPVKKLIKDIDERREKEMKRIGEELERRLGEFQQGVMERLGISVKEIEDAKAEPKPESKSQPKPEPAPKTTPKAAAQKKTASTTQKPKTAADNTDLTRIKGVGPVTAKKMIAAGIARIEQVANPTAAELEKIQSLANAKTVTGWADEAKKLIG